MVPPVDADVHSDVLLVSCGKEKASAPSAARDLYTSPTFRRARRYAEQAGGPWFILSAEHGVVAPDEWLSPYERYLPDTPSSFRRAWGEWVAARLELLLGSLRGTMCEIHAGREYVAAAGSALEVRGARLLLPLEGLRQGERLAWYDQRLQADELPAVAQGQQLRKATSGEDPSKWAEMLSASSRAVPPAALGDAGDDFRQPGLYSWWVDAEGASDLSRGLGHPVQPGLIYAGQAGATRWPSGKASGNTLWLRLVGMHLGKKARFSTFRKTLGSILRAERGWSEIDEAQLTEWMHDHLRVIALPHTNGDSLGDLEERVLQILDPPLNLRGMVSTPLRQRLRELRRAVAGAGDV